MARNVVFGCVSNFSFYFIQNQVQQIIIGLIRVLYHIATSQFFIERLDLILKCPILEKNWLKVLSLCKIPCELSEQEGLLLKQ